MKKEKESKMTFSMFILLGKLNSRGISSPRYKMYEKKYIQQDRLDNNCYNP